MPTLPLIAHATPDGIVAWQAGRAVTVRQFMADVQALAGSLPDGRHLLNLCHDRYHFCVGLAAAITAGKVNLLPSTHTPGVLRQIKDFAPDVFCLTDGTDSMAATADLPQLRYPTGARAVPATLAIPQIDTRQLAAIVFTSGSTGTPQPHPKQWGSLVSSVKAEAQRFGLAPGTVYSIVGTVPPQHMYGFESTVLMPWHTGHALCDAHPFYPADIVQALAAVPAPRILVSSPVHLRTLFDAGLDLPAVALVVSATAPLSAELAQAMEARCQAPLIEIYGSTETGHVASRHTTQTAEWQLFPGVTFTRDGDKVRASGGHVETAITMSDLIEPLDAQRFLLHGRLADMINIAGKRHSLASLNHLLNGITGVSDGAFYMPDGAAAGHVTRLAACVVAPQLTPQQVLSALRVHLDPVFLPRPLLFVDALPRTATGKLPREALRALIENRAGNAKALPVAAAGGLGNSASSVTSGTLSGSSRWRVPHDHPAFSGHFPGTPMVPGVLILDRVLQAVFGDAPPRRCEIRAAKFLHPAGPGDELLIRYERARQGHDVVRFEVSAGSTAIASGTVMLGPDGADT